MRRTRQQDPPLIYLLIHSLGLGLGLGLGFTVKGLWFRVEG
jgi:hypothetical protein